MPFLSVAPSLLSGGRICSRELGTRCVPSSGAPGPAQVGRASLALTSPPPDPGPASVGVRALAGRGGGAGRVYSRRVPGSVSQSEDQGRSHTVSGSDGPVYAQVRGLEPDGAESALRSDPRIATEPGAGGGEQCVVGESSCDEPHRPHGFSRYLRSK